LKTYSFWAWSERVMDADSGDDKDGLAMRRWWRDKTGDDADEMNLEVD